MRICFIADDRSPIAAGWIRFFVERGHETYVISSRARVLPGSSASLRVSVASVVAAREQLVHIQPSSAHRPVKPRSGLAYALKSELRGGRLAGLATVGAGFAGIMSAFAKTASVRRLVDEIEPDLVHALRIPFEGILAAISTRRVPLLLSVWGNDFTLHARRNPAVSALTRLALKRADALHCDCARDLHLAFRLGFDRGRPSVVLPGGGGVSDVFLQAGDARADPAPTGAPVVLNPRGLRAYVRNDTFFKAIPLVLQVFPNARFLCTGMRDEPVAQGWIEKLGIESSVELLPMLGTADLAACFARADISVSPSLHDGTPNTLLEAMAAGAFPVAGAIESIKEWITDGHNGLLCDPAHPRSVASAIVRGVQDAGMRGRAKAINRRLIEERARYVNVMPAVQDFYHRVVGQGSLPRATSEPLAATPVQE